MTQKKLSNYDDEINVVMVPSEAATQPLADPDLRNYYLDIGNRIFYLDGEVDSSTLEFVKFIARCNWEDKGLPPLSRKPIKYFINSNGGDVQVMLNVVNAIKMSKTPIYTVVYCNALSAAAHILAAGHKRFAMPGSTVLVHSGSCGYSGTIEQVESAKKYYESLGKRANDLFLKCTKVSPKDLKNKGARDWYMNEEDALALGIIDKIVENFEEVL